MGYEKLSEKGGTFSKNRASFKVGDGRVVKVRKDR